MILAIDIGNTRIKGAVFEGAMLLEVFVFTDLPLRNGLAIILEKFPNITDMVLASVGKIPNDAFGGLSPTVKSHTISHESRFPFRNDYATPLTLGIDRMVLASGAVLQFPKQDRLVIDAGTCVTYDFISSDNVYHGGAISPGIRLRYEALHTYTARLPLLTLEEPQDLIGNSTAQSIHSGVVNGIAGEIDSFIDRYREQYPNFIIILTGGDAVFLAKRLKNTIFANSNFLLESLNQTFQYRSTND